MIKKYGYVRVGAASPSLKVGNTQYNSEEIIKLIKKANDAKVQICVFPELSITGYSCADLFFQDTLLENALTSLKNILLETASLDIVSIIGLPLKIKNKLFNVATVIQKGNILGIIPKTYIPNYNEFYEARWFESGNILTDTSINLFDNIIPVSPSLIFEDNENKNISFGIEICEDLWAPISPSTSLSLNGATIIFNLSASNAIIKKKEYRRDLVKMESFKCKCAYIYASAGAGESTTDLVFSGHLLIAENGTLLNESENFSFDSSLIYEDIDTNKLMHDRVMQNTFEAKNSSTDSYIKIPLTLSNYDSKTIYKYSKTPFVPSDIAERNSRCNEILEIQATALAKRLKHIGTTKTVIGISGGLDSTLAFLVTVKAYLKLGYNLSDIYAITMPGFGTSDRTRNNATNLILKCGATLKNINIKEACIRHFYDIEHDINTLDVTYENTQARERTQILMDIANKINGIVVGTGDLSELALGFCTYNGDHMSMYNVNCSIPKTLVKYIISWDAENANDKEYSKLLFDILDTPVSPELLPTDNEGNIKQKTEDVVGPYILHDFFIYHFFRTGACPSKIFMIAKETFKDMFSEDEILKYLKYFIKRFFSQQFKRSAVPDGPKVGSVSFSPRGDLRMPSDADCSIWLNDLDNITN